MDFHYIHWAVPGVEAFMRPVDEALAERFLPALLVEEEVPG